MIDLEKLEQLAAKATPRPWTIADSDCCIDIFTDDEYIGNVAKPEDAAYIAAACDAVPKLIKMYREADDKANKAWEILLKAQAHIVELQKRVRGLEQQRVELAELAIYNNGCFDCPLEDVCLYKEELVRDSAVCSRLLIEWVEKAAKEAGK